MENGNNEKVAKQTLHAEVVPFKYEEGNYDNYDSSGPSMADKSGHGDLSLSEKAPKDAVLEGHAKSFDKPSSGQSHGVEIVPKDVKITGRNQVVPTSTGAIGFETSQEARPEKRKEDHIDWSQIASIMWTQISKGKVDSIPSQIVLVTCSTEMPYL